MARLMGTFLFIYVKVPCSLFFFIFRFFFLLAYLGREHVIARLSVAPSHSGVRVAQSRPPPGFGGAPAAVRRGRGAACCGVEWGHGASTRTTLVRSRRAAHLRLSRAPPVRTLRAAARRAWVPDR